jgi:hypothetical protein
MTSYLRVRNYEQFQHYKDRDPPWIKLYYWLLDDYAFAKLSDPSKWHLVGIFLLASRCGNRIAADAMWVRKKIGAKTPVDLATLEAAGFLEKVDDALAACKQPARPETETETEAETETERVLSAGADPTRIFESDSGRKTYPEDFEAFWTGYPTDPLMSKSKTFDQWRRMIPADRAAATNSLPAFRDFVKRQVNYHVVHPWKYLTERRYEGFVKTHLDPAAIAAAKDRADRLLKRGKYAEKYE